YLIIKRGEADKTLFIVWSLVILALTLAMRRFAYHFAVNAALLTGYFSWLILQLAGFRESAAEPVETPKEMERKAKKKKGRKDSSRLTASRPKMTLGVIAVLFLVFYPNIGPFPGGFMRAVDVASRPQSAPSDAWCESLYWLRENTPDPFGDPDFYYEVYETPFHYPETAYGVVAWWDRGYWIIRMGHRLPNCDPGSSAARPAVARLFVAQDEASADKEMKRLGSKYVIIDRDLAVTTMEKSYTVSGKFWGLATYAGSSKEEFYDVYYLLQADQLVPVLFFYPEYYRSLAVRLYNFDGGKAFVQTATVISYEERTSREGEPYKQITDAKSFPSYEQAEAYVSSQESGNVRIGGTDPFMSPVPLEALEHYKLIYSSDDSIMQPEIGRVSLVKIFEYVRGP
ncbi:MAG: hypothetical protein KAT75_10125, partial [Dehalococcoidia bacterium]|nr:hypothetical protein [Dehalococcoidia bacterium]